MALPAEEVDRLFERVLEEMPRRGVDVQYRDGESSAKLTARTTGATLFLGVVDIDDDKTSELIVNHDREPARKKRDQSNVTVDIDSAAAAISVVLHELGL